MVFGARIFARIKKTSESNWELEEMEGLIWMTSVIGFGVLLQRIFDVFVLFPKYDITDDKGWFKTTLRSFWVAMPISGCFWVIIIREGLGVK